MAKRTVRGVVLAGHKEDALEVPFDPGSEWQLEAVAIAPGRRGFPVQATLNGVRFRTHIVARSRRFWLLLDAAVRSRVAVATGDSVAIVVEPAEDG